MFKNFRQKRINKELNPDEIFLDSRNLPSFDKQQFEGLIEKPINKTSIYVAAILFLLIGLFFTGRIGFLQLVEGQTLAERSNNNRLSHTIIFPVRGIIYDRNDLELAWNDPDRIYTDQSGLAHILGFVGRPNQTEVDSGKYHSDGLIGK